MNIAAGVADVDLGNMTKLGQIGKKHFQVVRRLSVCNCREQ